MSGRSNQQTSRTRGQSPVPNALNVSRVQEKEELETLNNRLAVYIDSVRRLEQENRELKTRLESYTDSYSLESSRVKELYERELDEAKRLIEELARDKSRIEIELEKTKVEAEIVSSNASKKDRELHFAEKRVKETEVEINELRSRNECLVLDSNRKTDENQGLRGQNADLEQQVKLLKRQLETETLARIDMENKNKTLREELLFKEELHQTTVEEIRRHRQSETRNFDDGLRKQYDDRLLQELQQLRIETDREIQFLRDELSSQYEKKIEDLQSMLRQQSERFGNYRSDASAQRLKVEEVLKERDAFAEKVHSLEQRIRDLEERIHRIQERNDGLLTERDEQILRLKQQIEEMQMDYQNLLDIKITLDREIATYRKLLESEEERLNISSMSVHDRELIQNPLKRARYDSEEASSASKTSSSGIHIVEDDSAHPRFIKLINGTNQDLALAGWLLKRKVGTQSLEYKFPRGLILRAGATATIWSSDVHEITADPPTNIKLRTAKWFPSGNEPRTTILEDPEGRIVKEQTVNSK